MAKIRFNLSEIHEGGLPVDLFDKILPDNYGFNFEARSDNGEDEYECYEPEIDTVDATKLHIGSNENGQTIIKGIILLSDPEDQNSEGFFSGCRETGEIQISLCIVDSEGNEISDWSDHYTIPCEEE